MGLIGTGAVDQRAGRADLHTGTALDTSAFAERNIGISNDHALRAALCNRESEIARHFGASSHTTAAEDTTVVVQNKVRMRSIDREVVPTGLNRPVGHLFVVSGVLQFAISAADLAERAEVIAFAEQHGEHELARFLQRFCFGFHHHAIADRQRTRRHRHTDALHFHNAQAATAVWCQFFVVTQARDVNARHLCCTQNRRSFGDVNLLFVDRYLNHVILVSEGRIPKVLLSVNLIS